MSSAAVLGGERESGFVASLPESLTVATGIGPIALTLTSDIASLRARWMTLQAMAPCTSAQTYSHAEAWARLVLLPARKRPLIVVGSDGDGRDLFLWAFEVRRGFGPKVLRWLGESHASYAMGLTLPGVARLLSARDMRNLLDAVARKTGVAAAFLSAQPYAWDGVANPFAKLSGQPAPSNGYAVRLGDFESLYERRFSGSWRSKTMRKDRRLRDAGAIDVGWAETEAERLEVLDTLFGQKARQLAALGVKNPFNPRVRAFYREMSLLPAEDPARLRLGALRVNGAVVATHSGALCHDRLVISISSLAAGGLQRYSPGGFLLRKQIEEACNEGLAYYDLGAGAGPSKDEWCDLVQPLFDSFIAFSAPGFLLTGPAALGATVKRTIKSNRHLWPRVQRWRRTLPRQTVS